MALSDKIVDALGGSILDGAAAIIGKFKEDPTKKAEYEAAANASKAEFELISLKLAKQIEQEVNAQANAIALAQIKINEADARGSRFQSSWRPLVGYICAAGLGYQMLIRTLINFVAQALGSKATAEQLDMGTLLSLLIPLLGLGAYRTVEKLQEKQ